MMHETEPGTPLPPGSTIGILGGGQLGRMIALAAAQLGYRCHVFCPSADEPASQVSAQTTVAPYEEEAALARFAEAVDVVTLEFENVPVAATTFLAQHVPVRPGSAVLHVCQNRLREKDFLASINVPTTRYMEASGPDALVRALRDFGAPVILKSAEFGYDGKGQVMVSQSSQAQEAWDEMRRHAPDSPAIIESFVDFHAEVSVIVARGLDGAISSYPAVENKHRNHILDQTIAPARLPPEVMERAEVIARHVVEGLDVVGLLAVEMFVTGEGRLLVNELAPRPHNSGHWTIDACLTSQFEQLVRAVVGLPLGSSERLANAVMRNILGEDIERWREFAADPNARLHLYGKRDARPGRKMGHVTRLLPRD